MANGPRNKSESMTYPGTLKRIYHSEWSRYSQSGRPPYKEVQPYLRFMSTCQVDPSGIGTYNGAPLEPWSDSPNGPYAEAVQTGRYNTDALASNAAYSRMRSGLTSASLGASLAEYGESFSMIAARSSQLLGALRQAKRFNIPGMLRELGPLPPTHRKAGRGALRHPADFGDLWLEYSFGWAPLVKDIYDACDVLQKPLVTHLRGRASASEQFTYSVGSYPPGAGSNAVRGTYLYRCSVEQGCDVFVNNPNLALANQLGLINPAAIAWELVPFSFVVDWFVPVGDMLNSWSEWFGFTVTNRYASVKRVCTGSAKNWYRNYSNQLRLDNGDLSSFAVQFRRTLGNQNTQIAGTLKAPSPARAANSISLLLGFLNRA